MGGPTRFDTSSEKIYCLLPTGVTLKTCVETLQLQVDLWFAKRENREHDTEWTVGYLNGKFTCRNRFTGQQLKPQELYEWAMTEWGKEAFQIAG